MDLQESFLGKRNFSVLEGSTQQRPDEDCIPVKKKLRTKLVDLFNRASVSMIPPEDYIKVYLRIKPFAQDESASQRCFVVTEEDNTLVATAPEQSHAYRNMKRGLANSSHTFTFSRIFNEGTSQGDFFNATMLGMTKDFISGQNSLVFTYGVTSSGKTYTIQGQAQNAGILPRCLDVVFNSISGKQIPSMTSLKPRMFTDIIRLTPTEVAQEKRIKDRTLRMSIDDDTTVMALLGDEMESALSDTATASSSGCGDELLHNVESRDREKLKVDVEDQGQIRFGVWVSFAEIYNEQIFDLLEPIPRKKIAKRPVLKICDDRNGNPYIKGLKEIHVETADEAYRLLTIGRRNLQTACTRLNHCSSRSHCIFNIKIVRVVDKDDPNVARVSMLSLCDLAGSERYSKTQSTGDRLKEAGSINASLMTLGRCIETLRHNQQHRDQQRLVPFRDSKLTRLLQNYFNGSGRAAMIVNVSQCPSMFDDTLHVFKFSAIAQLVKYIEKPPEPPKKVKEKKVIPPALRPSIEWEMQAPIDVTFLKDARNQPLPGGDDDVDDDDGNDDLQVCEDESSEENSNISDVNEMRIYIKTLELRIERLVEMLQEELDAAKNIEQNVRHEVTQAMMKQIVHIEETYSVLLKETSEDVQEIADERMRGIMEVYEQRLERIQKKVDDDDEWVSSLLYHQQQIKLEERDATILDLRKQIDDQTSQIADLKSKCANDSVDIGNSVLIETLTQKLQEAKDKCKNQDGEIQELESHIVEAGEVYNRHIEEIATLTEQNENMKTQLSSLKGLENQLKEITASYENLKLSLKGKENEWKTMEEKFKRRIETKDNTISSLQDECKELHEEIEKLQDRMSQMDDNSRYRNELETSVLLEQKSSTCDSDIKQFDDLSEQEKLESEEDCDRQRTKGKSSLREILEDTLSSDQVTELRHLKEENVKKDNEVETLKHVNVELDKQIKCLQSKIDELVTEINLANEKYSKSVVDAEMLQKSFDELQEELHILKQCATTAEEKLASSHQANDQIRNELENLQKVHVEVNKNVQDIEQQLEDMSKKPDRQEHAEVNTIASQLNKETEPLVSRTNVASTLNTGVMNQSDDNEIVFNIKVAGSLQEQNSKLKEENVALQIANCALTERCQVLEDQLNGKDSMENMDQDSKDVNIGEMVKQIEQKATPFDKNSVSHINDVDHGDKAGTVLKNAVTTLPVMSSEVIKTPSVGVPKTSGSMTMKLKDAELANAALRSKLKREEDDFFKREQALIHGYTAEIETLKYELAKMKSKIDVPSKTLTRGKRKAAVIDTSMSSLVCDSINEISVLGDSKLVNVQTESMVSENQSVYILSNELLSVQQELSSLGAAYRKLLTAKRRNKTNSFIQDVVLGSASHFPTASGVFRAEEKFGDSVLQFELDEYAVKMDEMRIRITQQDDEIKISKTAFEKVNAEKLKIENKLKEILLKQESQQEETSILTEGLKKRQTFCKNIEEKFQETFTANSVLHLEDKEHQDMIKQLKETLNSAITERNETEQRLNDVTEQLNVKKMELQNVQMNLKKVQEAVEDANNEQDKLKEKIKNLMEVKNLQNTELEQQLQRLKDLLKQTEGELISCKEDFVKQENILHESNKQLTDTVAEKARLEESAKRTHEELVLCKEKVSVIEQMYSDAKETLEKTVSIKDNIDNKLKHANEKLASSREEMNSLKEEYDSRINVLKQEYSGEGKANLEAIIRLEKTIDDLKAQLLKKSAELEKLECQKQEEAAEVSQKLLMLEREKRLADRKAADAKERETEWQQKCQGLENMAQLEQQMRQDLRTTAESMRKHSVLTSELKDELAIKNKELDQLKEELDSVKKSSKKTQDLELKVKELDLSLASEKKQLQEVQKSNEELRSGLREFGETIGQQEFIINYQDDELNTLKANLDTQSSEIDKLKSTITQKELTLVNLNQRISQLEAEITSLKQSELAAMSVEQNCHDQLQKSHFENRELEDRIKNLEKENNILNDKMGSSENEIRKERKVLEDMEETMEKMKEQKKDLEREIEQKTGKQRILEEQMERCNQQREKDLEQLHLMGLELRNLKKESHENIEKNKHMDELHKENADMKEELNKLRQDILIKEKEMDKVHETLKQTTESLKGQEKELKKQDSINKRNREEMENWKQERDVCVSKLEQHINKGLQENKQLVQEIEKIKKDNADLAKNVESITAKKDSVIAELRKVNNTLSIQLARVQGMSPPPKIATPDNSYMHRNEFIEDLDTTGHLEIDATPPVAAKKCRKWQGSARQTLSSLSVTSADSETWTTPVYKSLKPIEEQNENSPSSTRTTSPTKSSLHGRVAEIANDVLCSISPLTRSAKRQEKENKKKQLSSVQIPFDLASYVAASDTQNENANPYSTRRSSRLKTKTKH